MLIWTYSESIKTTASPESVWNLWTNMSSWPEWDKGVAWAKLETTFLQGEYIAMKPVRGPAVRCLLEEVTPLRSFTTRSSFPLATLSFKHHIDDGIVTHGVEMRGILTPLFRRLFGRDIQKGLPQAVRSLVAMAELAGCQTTK